MQAMLITDIRAVWPGGGRRSKALPAERRPHSPQASQAPGPTAATNLGTGGSLAPASGYGFPAFGRQDSGHLSCPSLAHGQIQFIPKKSGIPEGKGEGASPGLLGLY